MNWLTPQQRAEDERIAEMARRDEALRKEQGVERLQMEACGACGLLLYGGAEADGGHHWCPLDDGPPPDHGTNCGCTDPVLCRQRQDVADIAADARTEARQWRVENQH